MERGILTEYPKGSDITLLNTIFHYKDSNHKHSQIDIIYMDNKTGYKGHESIVNPDYEFYMAKPEIEINHNLFFIEKEKADMIRAPYDDLLKKIAELTGNLDFFYSNIRDGNRAANKRLHLHERIFRSDTNISDHYRYRFSKDYKNESYLIKKAFLDIEVDNSMLDGEFPELGECPINAVSVIFEDRKEIYSYILRDYDNELCLQFEQETNNGLHIEELLEFVRQQVGEANVEKMGLKDLKIQYMFFDTEIDMLKTIFNRINILQPDFLMAWNMAFDIPYCIERIKALGFDPTDIMCCQDFDRKVCEYYIDYRNQNNPDESGDMANISSYTVYIDQLIQFASRRKNQTAFQSYSLDSIGGEVANVRKYDYKHITTNLAELPKLDFKTFIFYNIMDTVVQWAIEVTTGDIDYLFNKCLENNTRYSKAHRQTVYLVNRAAVEFEDQGFIICNNVNKYNEKPETKFPGAYVADPLKLSDYAKMKINGQAINVYNNLDDFDYARLYPSQIMENNMGPNTQVGKIIIDEKVWVDEDRFNYKYFTRSGAYAEDYASGNRVDFAYRWHHFPSYEQLIDDFREYFSEIEVPFYPLEPIDMVKGLVKPIVFRRNNLVKPFRILSPIRPFDILHPMNKESIREFIYNGAGEVINIDYTTFKDIFNYMKLTKADIGVIFEDGTIYGLNIDDGKVNLVYRLKCPIIGYGYMCEINKVAAMIKYLEDPNGEYCYKLDSLIINIDTENNSINIVGTGGESVINDLLYGGVFTRMYLHDIVKYLDSRCTKPCQYRIDDLKQDPGFVEMMGYKSKDGAVRYIVGGKYLMYIVPSTLSINKSDKASLEIYEDFENIFICKIIVIKKSVCIEEFIRFIQVI